MHFRPSIAKEKNLVNIYYLLGNNKSFGLQYTIRQTWRPTFTSRGVTYIRIHMHAHTHTLTHIHTSHTQHPHIQIHTYIPTYIYIYIYIHIWSSLEGKEFDSASALRQLHV